MKILIGFLALSFCAFPVHAFTLISNHGKLAWWPSRAPSYRYHTQTSGYFPAGVDHSGTITTENAQIDNAFASWMGAGSITLNITKGADVSATPTTDDGINTIMWVRSAWRSLSFRPPSNALAVTLLSFDVGSGALVNADMYFNAEYFKWARVDDPSETGYVDVQNIATHEIGHFLGLDHSSETITEGNPALADATMFYASGPGETSARTLHADDIRGIRNLYGSGTPAVPTISAASRTGSSNGNDSYALTGTDFNDSTQFVLVSSNGGVSDSPSRYFTITSATQATATFDVAGFPAESTAARIIAFNSPTQYSSYAVQVIGGGQFSASSTSSKSGGCELMLRDGEGDSQENLAQLQFQTLLGLISMLSITVAIRKNAKGRMRRIYLVKKA